MKLNESKPIDRPTRQLQAWTPFSNRWLTVAPIAMALVMGMAHSASASTAYGSLNNFDCVNDTGNETHGFEIELDYGHTTDITYTYDYNHYGTPKIYEDATDPAHPKVFVRYESKKNSDGTWAAFTAIPSAPILPTQGHQFTNPSINFGGEHFGVGFTGNPAAVKYNWLVDDGSGNLIHGPAVYISTPSFTYVPAAPGIPAQVIAAVVPPPPPAPPVFQFGKASWVKEIKTQFHNPHKVALNQLVGDDPGKPQPWANGEKPEVEMEWRILQTEFAGAGGGKNHELKGAPEGLDGGNETITRRYEFYKYVGPIDAETGEAMGDQVAADGIHGKGTVTYADHFDFATGEWVTVTKNLANVVVVGEFFGTQMAGFDIAPNLGLIDHIQDCDVDTALPDRSVAISGGFPFIAGIKSGQLPTGLSLDPISGVLSGTPTTAGAFVFTVEASDTAGTLVSKVYTMNIVGDVPFSYTLSASAWPVRGGRIKGSGTFAVGIMRTLVAVPVADYAFVNWTENGNVVGLLPGYTLLVDADHTLVANFARICQITTAPSIAIGGTTTGDITVTRGTSVTVGASANAGYAFVNWTFGTLSASRSPIYTFTASSTRTLIANFVKTYAINVSSAPKIGGTAKGSGMRNEGSNTTVVAIPRSGYAFVNWTENGVAVSDQTNYTFPVTGERTLVANFVKA